MRILRSLDRVPEAARGAVVAVGNFDGVHPGHRAVIDTAIRIARNGKAKAAVLTFEPHPRSMFRPGDPPFRLTPFRAKAAVLAGLGLDLMFVPRFDRKLAARSAEEFVAHILGRALGVRHVVCGRDFAFGKGRQGDVALLERLARANGFEVTAVAPAGDGTQVYSSTAIRERLAAGDPLGAARLMGRPFAIHGHVLRGEQLGRKLGFPTANVDHGGYLEPKFGVYAVRAAIDGDARALPGVANFGRRPTVGGVRTVFEVHLFDFAHDLYGRHLMVQFVDFIRPERKFDSFQTLTAQIAKDCVAARRILAAAADGNRPRARALTP